MRFPYKCIHCGLTFSGRLDPNSAIGEVKAYDRAPTADVAPLDACCWTCKERIEKKSTKKSRS